MNNVTHWTERSPEDFLYSIASDFVEQLQAKMATINNMTRAKLAKLSGISKGRISQVFNDPGNVSLDTAIKLARALGLEVSLLTYEKVGDPDNERGPVNADVFRMCWKRAGHPFDMWDVQRSSNAAATSSPARTLLPEHWGYANYKDKGWHTEKATYVKHKPTRATVQAKTLESPVS
jgi:transcriptional regulator with XRE-family HTH domain